jgi:hypothetical protein
MFLTKDSRLAKAIIAGKGFIQVENQERLLLDQTNLLDPESNLLKIHLKNIYPRKTHKLLLPISKYNKKPLSKRSQSKNLP